MTFTDKESRTGPLVVLGVVALTGPAVLAFFAGGYFDGPRVWAGLIVSALVVVAMLTTSRPLPTGLGGRLALIGLALLAAWTLVSFTWAPIAGNAYHAGQRVILYAGALLAAAALLRERAAQRAVEPVLALGALVVIGYGLSERMLPGVFHFSRSLSAEGRLEQPLTYWNAMGEVAAIGLVLCVRIVGTQSRRRPLRIAAAAAVPPLGMGLYLSFSRGALFACAAGLVTLIIVAPRWAQLRALLLAICTGSLAALAAAPFGGVTSLAGAQATRERQGVIALAALAVLAVASGFAQRHLQRREPGGELQLPRRAPLIALGVICAGFAVAVAVGAKETSRRPLTSGATRYATLQSDRYDYWRVALRAFREEPVRGVGAGGWTVYWLRWRRTNVGAQDAHSLPLQTAAELGLVGLAFLATFLTGVAIAARTTLRASPECAAGPIAGFVVWAAHAPLDWDWQMPAVTLIALVLAGSLVALETQVVAERRERGASEDNPPVRASRLAVDRDDCRPLGGAGTVA